MALGLLIAVDFGTTFLKVSFAFDQQHSSQSTLAGAAQNPGSSSINMVKDWRPENIEYVPNHIGYRREDQPNHGLEDIVWGYGVNCLPDHKRQQYNIVRCAKACLHSSKENTQLLEANKWPSIKNRLGDRNPAEDVLKCLYDELVGSENAVFKKSFPREMQNKDLKIQFIFGIPTTWSLPEQVEFMDLARTSGMPDAMRALEPEAMAVYFFSQYRSFKARS